MRFALAGEIQTDDPATSVLGNGSAIIPPGGTVSGPCRPNGWNEGCTGQINEISQESSRADGLSLRQIKFDGCERAAHFLTSNSTRSLLRRCCPTSSVDPSDDHVMPRSRTSGENSISFCGGR